MYFALLLSEDTREGEDKDSGWAETFDDQEQGLPEYRDETHPPWTPTGEF